MPAFDPRGLKGAQAGPPTRVSMIGSTHVSQHGRVVSWAMLAPLLDKLAAFSPTIVT